MAGEGAALPELAVDLEPRFVVLQRVLDDRESESGAAAGARAPRVDPIEALGQPREVCGRDADPGVPHREMRAVAISVADEGEGIAREHIPRLTERFYRVDTARSRDLGGTGLGLAIVKHIVARHRGVLDIDSVVGKGSRFTVYLPAAPEIDLPRREQAQPAAVE